MKRQLMSAKARSAGTRALSLASILAILAYLLAFVGVQPVQAAITQPGAWASQYASTTYPSGTVNASYTVAAGTDRLLVVAIASTRTAAGSQTVSVSYGGLPLYLAAGDGSSTATWNHSYIYLLDEGDIQAAANDDLNVTITGGTAYYTWVYAAVFAGVDQGIIYTDAVNYNSNSTSNTAVGPFNPLLAIGPGDQAIQIVNLARGDTNFAFARSISTWASGWTTPGIEPVSITTSGPTATMYIRNRVVTTAAYDPSQHTASSSNTWKSMTAMSISAGGAPASPATFTAPGTYSWKAPLGVTSVQVEVWGGGGGGGGDTSSSNNGGGGGGGGAYARLNSYAVTPGQSYTFQVGSAGAAGGGSGGTGGTGGNSFFVNTSTLNAAGGTGGVGGNTGTGGTGGAVGATGDVKFSGGNGATGSSVGGGGGGSGGTGSAGNNGGNGAPPNGAAAVTGGGPGGTGGNGAAGSVPASGPGGGGGGADSNSGADTAGGAGFAGQVVITFTIAPTAATVSQPEAAAEPDAIQISWESFDEQDILGYKLYRSSALDGLRSQIYQVQAVYRGQMRGATYSFPDSSAEPNMLYYYWLEVLHPDGSTAWMEPVTASLSPQAVILFMPLIVK